MNVLVYLIWKHPHIFSLCITWTRPLTFISVETEQIFTQTKLCVSKSINRISQEYLKGSEEKQSHIKAPAVPPPLYTFTSQQTFWLVLLPNIRPMSSNCHKVYFNIISFDPNSVLIITVKHLLISRRYPPQMPSSACCMLLKNVGGFLCLRYVAMTLMHFCENHKSSIHLRVIIWWNKECMIVCCIGRFIKSVCPLFKIHIEFRWLSAFSATFIRAVWMQVLANKLSCIITHTSPRVHYPQHMVLSM